MRALMLGIYAVAALGLVSLAACDDKDQVDNGTVTVPLDPPTAAPTTDANGEVRCGGEKAIKLEGGRWVCP